MYARQEMPKVQIKIIKLVFSLLHCSWGQLIAAVCSWSEILALKTTIIISLYYKMPMLVLIFSTFFSFIYLQHITCALQLPLSPLLPGFLHTPHPSHLCFLTDLFLLHCPSEKSKPGMSTNHVLMFSTLKQYKKTPQGSRCLFSFNCQLATT